jgi:signal transduction histidine kinase
MSDEQRAFVQPILLAIGFLLLIAISAATVWLVNRSAEDARLVAHTLRVQDTFSNVLLSVRRAESGQRGYLLTNEERYLADYRNAQPENRRQLSELRELTQDNPARKELLDELERLATAKFEEMEKSISLNRSGKVDEARALVLTDQGRDLMTVMRLIVERAIFQEGELLTLRSQASQRNASLLLLTTLLGAALVVAVGATSFILMRRSVQQRERARQELAVINANLERIVEFRTADLTEANEEIQRFAYIVSHDLRSPLVNIMGFTTELEALRKDIFAQVEPLQRQLAALNAKVDAPGTPLETLGKDFDESVGFIKTSIAKMDRLINAVLKLSREGRRQFHPERLDMNEMLESIDRTVAHRAAEQAATIEIGDLPPVESDRLAVEQIFSNLVDNALKYGRAGVPTRIQIDHRSTPTHVIYDVRDNGRGIDAQDHQRVFELFRRSGVQDRPGEGIGLAHVRALVRRLGGTLTLKSELGQGSTFTVTLPRRWQGETRSAA